jgi:tungstate transport system permease protein
MTELGDAFAATWRILASGDAEVLEIVALSLRVTGAAVVLAALAGLPLGTWLGWQSSGSAPSSSSPHP